VRLAHFSHSAGANRREDFIGAESFAGLERHLADRANFSGSREGQRLNDGS
jgi:hypothetical protein